MRLLFSVIVLFLTACTAQPSFEELEAEAIASGDWTAVESREEAAERRREKAGPICEGEQTRVCVETGPVEECSCIPPNNR
jgi:hypothetical protein